MDTHNTERYTVVGAATGKPYATAVDVDVAWDWLRPYASQGSGVTYSALLRLEVGERLSTDVGTVGIYAQRIS